MNNVHPNDGIFVSHKAIEKTTSVINKFITNDLSLKKFTSQLSEDNPVKHILNTCKIDERLDDMKHTYLDIFNSVTEAIYILDDTFHVIDTNKGATKLFKTKKEYLIGINAENCAVDGKNDLNLLDHTFKQVLQTGKSAYIEFWTKRWDGSVFLQAVNINKGYYFGKDVLILTARDITKNKLKKDKLERSKEKYKLIIENTSDIIVVINTLGDILFVNDSKLERLGYETGEIIQTSFTIFAPETEIPMLFEKLNLAVTEKTIEKFESKIFHKKGHLVDVEITGKSLLFEGETCVICTVRDITEKKQAERNLHYQFDLRQLMMELSSTFINIPLNKSHCAINNAIKKLTHFIGADRGYLFNYDYENQISSNTFEYTKDNISAEISNLQNIPFSSIQYWIDLHLDEKNIVIENINDFEDPNVKSILKKQGIKSLIATPLITNGTCIGFVGFDFVSEFHEFYTDQIEMLEMFAQMMVNVQQRIIAEENNTKRLMAIEQSPTSIIITDRNGTIEYVNPIAAEVSGYKKTELIGEKTSIFKSGIHHDAFYNDLWTTILKNKTWKGELLNKKKNGELIWENTIISPIIKDEKISHFVSIQEDITARKSIIHELKRAKEKAEESDQLKSAFLANMSHEIRSPLNGIIGFSSFLAEDGELSREEVKRYANIVSNSGNHLLNIINDIIYISKFDAGHIIPVIEPINLKHLLFDLYELYKERLEESDKNIRINLINNYDDVVIDTDGTRLRQVLENLLSNAIKFTANGNISFGYQLDGSKIQFFVKDTGIGIAEEKQSKIFDRFVQASTKTEKLYGGTGLGLSITKACVNLLGGDVWVKSKPGDGSTFFFDIDYVPNKQGVTTKNKDIEEIEFSGENILIAEDDDVSYLFLKKVLSEYNLKVWRAETGLEAVNKAVYDKSIDLILMDIQMPQMDGIQATYEIKDARPGLPIIAQTANAFDDERIKCLEAGCIDYISKPIDKSILGALLQMHLQPKFNISEV
ncbi:PAS domain S-box protein [Labilibacter marinus]|uniref:PAS domain S-box protein n=1 Tax=Labilibacter marinus TaxID=1477105 RepID=UPI0008298AB5|nr:PAS domain S-box protein [Labilibacter marinus]